MNKFLDTIFLNNEVRSYLLVAGIIIFLLLFKRLLSRYIASLFYLLIKKKWQFIEKEEFFSLILRPLSWFITVTISVMVIDKLNFPDAWEFKIYGVPTHDILPKIGNSLIILYFIFFLLKFINFISLIFEYRSKKTETKDDDQLVLFLRDFLKVLVGIFGFLLILKAGFNQDLGAFLTGLSIVGAALALAAKESIENLIASFIIFFDKPFYTGDNVKVNNVSGTVEHIGLRSTRIRTSEQTLVTVPNKQMVDSVVDNISNLTKRRAEIKLEFAPGTNVEVIKDFIAFAKNYLNSRNEKILSHTVYLGNISNTGAMMQIEYFTIPFSLSEFNNLKQEVNFTLMKEMNDKGIVLAVKLGEFNVTTKSAPVPPKNNSLI